MKKLIVPLVILLAVSSAWAGRRAGGGSVSREGPNGGSVEAEGGHVGRFGAGSVEATGPNGGTADAEGARAGRFGAGSVDATGANGGSVEAQGARAGRYGTGSVDATGANGGTYNAETTRAPGYTSRDVSATGANGGTYNASYNGYRSGYYYSDGAYRQANIAVNSVYVAPLGAYAGYSVLTQPYYVTYPQYATYPVEVAVQVELTRQGYYAGKIDGVIGPSTQQAITKYQAANGLPPNGNINKALLQSLNII